MVLVRVAVVNVMVFPEGVGSSYASSLKKKRVQNSVLEQQWYKCWVPCRKEHSRCVLRLGDVIRTRQGLDLPR